MPQMAPMNWMILYVVFLVALVGTMTKIFFLK